LDKKKAGKEAGLQNMTNTHNNNNKKKKYLQNKKKKKKHLQKQQV
jgi:hypothetical protein